MDRIGFNELFRITVRSGKQSCEEYDHLAEAVIEAYVSDAGFREHLSNRAKRVKETTGQAFDPDRFDIAMARAFVADEIGYPGWHELLNAVEHGPADGQTILFRYAVAALRRGDFTSLENTVGGPAAFEPCISDWFNKGYFANEPETLNEVFAASCWLGHAKTAECLLDNGVDPYAGMRTGLSGFHWAASSGKLEVIKLLVRRKVPMEIKGMYDNTVLGQALYSAINEHTPHHAELIETLIEGGAHVWPDTLEWWNEQTVPSAETKRRVANALQKAEGK